MKKFTFTMKSRLSFKLSTWIVLFSFLFSSITLPRSYAQETFSLPNPGMMVNASPQFMPSMMKGIKIFPDNPLRFDFIIDTGHSGLEDEALKTESTKLIKYFLATLTVPENDLWVNLSPYEKDRIISDTFSVTEMGRDLLAQDYLLKQLTATLMYPEKDLGKKFWEKIYSKVSEVYGPTELPVNTFNKVWVVPDKAVIYESGDTAFIVESHLKVMLDGDYLALKKNLNNEKLGTDQIDNKDAQKLNDVSSAIIKEVILPEIEKEVNEGGNFTALRQVYHSMVLATWFKRNLKLSFLGKVYVGEGKVTGIDIEDKKVKEKIYQQYLEAFKTGVYNYIKEDYDPATQEIISHKYFSGGMEFTPQAVDQALLVEPKKAEEVSVRVGETTEGELQTVSVVLDPIDEGGVAVLSQANSLIEPNRSSDQAMLTSIAEAERLIGEGKIPEAEEILLSLFDKGASQYYSERQEATLADGKVLKLEVGDLLFIAKHNLMNSILVFCNFPHLLIPLREHPRYFEQMGEFSQDYFHRLQQQASDRYQITNVWDPTIISNSKLLDEKIIAFVTKLASLYTYRTDTVDDRKRLNPIIYNLLLLFVGDSMESPDEAGINFLLQHTYQILQMGSQAVRLYIQYAHAINGSENRRYVQRENYQNPLFRSEVLEKLISLSPNLERFENYLRLMSLNLDSPRILLKEGLMKNFEQLSPTRQTSLAKYIARNPLEEPVLKLLFDLDTLDIYEDMGPSFDPWLTLIISLPSEVAALRDNTFIKNFSNYSGLSQREAI